MLRVRRCGSERTRSPHRGLRGVMRAARTGRLTIHVNRESERQTAKTKQHSKKTIKTTKRERARKCEGTGGGRATDGENVPSLCGCSVSMKHDERSKVRRRTAQKARASEAAARARRVRRLRATFFFIFSFRNVLKLMRFFFLLRRLPVCQFS